MYNVNRCFYQKKQKKQKKQNIPDDEINNPNFRNSRAK